MPSTSQPAQSDIQAASTACLDFLQNNQITHTQHAHPPAHTVEDARRYSHHIEGTHCKNLFLKGRKQQYFLLTIPALATIDLTQLAVQLDVPRLGLGHVDRLWHLLKVKPGAVSPLSVIHDTETKVTVIFDAVLAEASYLNFPPADNTITVNLSRAEIERYLELAKHPVRYMSMPYS